MNKTLSPLRTSLYLVLKLLEMNCRCRQGKGKEWEGGKHRDTKPVRPVGESMETTGWVTLALGRWGECASDLQVIYRSFISKDFSSPGQTSFYLVLKLIEMKAYRNEEVVISEPDLILPSA